MKPLKIALIAVAALILTPILLAQGLNLYLSMTNFMDDTDAGKSRAAASGARDCVGMKENRPSAWDIGDEKYAQYLKDWIETCQREAAADSSPPVQLSLFKALFAADRRPEAIVVLRALAATDNTEALVEIYEWHRSWEGGDVDRPQTVRAREAGEALRKAAELGNAYAIRRYAINLDQGSIIKRDVDAAAYWMEKSLKNPPKDATQVELAIALGQLLTQSTEPKKRARGIRILESIERPNAKAYLAEAIRKDDPVRARSLLEGSLSAWPGAALPPLADMLIRGEGGPADPKRALKLLQSHSNKSAPASINAALGKLYAEGKLVPRDPQKAAELMSGATQWSVEAKLTYARFLTDNPTVKSYSAMRFLYELTAIAELGEPEAMTTLIALKLSPNPEFADKAGGCKLAERAAAGGDESAKTFLTACAVN